MAKGFDILNVKSAVKSRNKFDLSRTHLTTMNFGEIVPLFVEETVPGDDIKVVGNYFSRMAPLVKPTYGKFQFKTMTAFVPYHQIADDADAWLAGKDTWEGSSTHQRFVTIEQLCLFVVSYCATLAGNENNADIVFKASDGSLVYRRYSSFGKYCVKVLNSLGYAIPQGIDFSSGSSWLSGIGQTRLSAYPLLAFFKAYNDYMSQSQRFNVSPLSNFLKSVKHNVVATAGGYLTTGSIAYTGLKVMFDNLKLCYDNDYFTSAWQSPNSPLTQDTSLITTGEVPASSDYTVRMDDANKLMAQGGDAFTQISQRALDFLKSFDDWVRRNNYSGSRAVQQVYSRFGIKTDDYRSNYAHVLSTDIMPVQVGDITATAQDFIGAENPKNVVVGDYAGKGIVSGTKSVECKADDYGLLIVLGYFTVTPMNAYGFNRLVLRNTPLDYYNPEFDGIGADAISVGEYFTSPISTSTTTTDKSVYGYTERYNAYRYGRDNITGDFRNYHKDSDMNVWHTGRLLGDIRDAGNLVAQSSSVNTLPQTSSEYNRIFSVTDGSVDTFYVTAQFKVDAIRPMLNLNQVVKLGEGNTAVPRNGNVIS